MSIYVASKIKHAPMWKWYRDRGFPIISTWINNTEGECDYVDLWLKCISEASSADCLVVFTNHGSSLEILKGAFVEVGAALANGKKVYAVGLRESDGSWLHHPLVTKCETIEEAMELAKGSK